MHTIELPAEKFETRLSWQLLHRLETEYGDSFYILHIRKCENNYREFLSAFRSIYLNTGIAYSYKTNYTPWLCNYFYSMGAYAEVVSKLEYDLAIRIGVPPQRIIYNGPLKYARDMEEAILAGAIVNLDALHEVKIVQDVAQRYADRELAVGLRCNFDVGDPLISRFGFDAETGGVDDVFRMIGSLKNCRIAGLHCHFSTKKRSIASYALRTKKMLELCDRYFTKNNPEFVDVGGGFFGKMDVGLRNQFDCPIPGYREYAEAIAPQFLIAFPEEPKPELILEPGISLVGDVMQFVGKIIGVKAQRTRRCAVATGSIFNVRPTQTEKKVSMRVYKNDTLPNREYGAGPVDVCGYTCMEHDCLYQGYEGSLAAGDYVVFDNVGAYTTVLKPPFIAPSPPILLYDSVTDTYRLIKRREAFDDIFAAYRM